MKKQRTIPFLCMLLAVMTLLPGCANQPSGGASSAPSSATESQKPESKAPEPDVDETVWSGYDLIKLAQGHQREKLSYDLQIDDTTEEAGKYAALLNGPIVYTVSCPYDGYKNYVTPLYDPIDLKLMTVREINESAPGTVWSEEKQEALKNGEAKPVYCFVEAIGIGGRVMFQNQASHFDLPSVYHVYYRVSFWNAESDELLGWFTHKVGVVKESYSSKDEFYKMAVADIKREEDDLRDEVTEVYVFREEDGKDVTPLNCVERIVYGSGQETEASSASSQPSAI